MLSNSFPVDINSATSSD